MQADCVSDCQKVIKAAQQALDAKDAVIAAQSKANDDLQHQLILIQTSLNSDDARLNSVLWNPWVDAGIGFLAGAITYSVIRH